MMPTEYNGSLVLYRRVIRPKFIQYQPNVDNLIENAKKASEFRNQQSQHLTTTKNK